MSSKFLHKEIRLVLHSQNLEHELVHVLGGKTQENCTVVSHKRAASQVQPFIFNFVAFLVYSCIHTVIVPSVCLFVRV